MQVNNIKDYVVAELIIVLYCRVASLKGCSKFVNLLLDLAHFISLPI